MNSRITAKEARAIMNSVNMKQLLLRRLYFFIRDDAEKGQDNTKVYVDEFEMSDVKTAIQELKEDGFTVSLNKSELFFEGIKTFSNITIKW